MKLISKVKEFIFGSREPINIRSAKLLSETRGIYSVNQYNVGYVDSLIERLKELLPNAFTGAREIPDFKLVIELQEEFTRLINLRYHILTLPEDFSDEGTEDEESEVVND